MSNEATRRDVAWDLVLHELRENGQVQLRQIEADESFKRTLSRTLSAMEELGWLERESERAHTFYPSTQFNRICAHVLKQSS